MFDTMREFLGLPQSKERQQADDRIESESTAKLQTLYAGGGPVHEYAERVVRSLKDLDDSVAIRLMPEAFSETPPPPMRLGMTRRLALYEAAAPAAERFMQAEQDPSLGPDLDAVVRLKTLESAKAYIDTTSDEPLAQRIARRGKATAEAVSDYLSEGPARERALDLQAENAASGKIPTADLDRGFESAMGGLSSMIDLGSSVREGQQAAAMVQADFFEDPQRHIRNALAARVALARSGLLPASEIVFRASQELVVHSMRHEGVRDDPERREASLRELPDQLPEEAAIAGPRREAVLASDSRSRGPSAESGAWRSSDPEAELVSMIRSQAMEIGSRPRTEGVGPETGDAATRHVMAQRSNGR